MNYFHVIVHVRFIVLGSCYLCNCIFSFAANTFDPPLVHNLNGFNNDNPQVGEGRVNDPLSFLSYAFLKFAAQLLQLSGSYHTFSSINFHMCM